MIGRRGESKAIVIIAVVAVVISAVAALVTYFSVANLMTQISGLASSTGEANLTVETVAEVNFTTRSINWGSGRVTQGAAAAFLDTTVGTVKNGNWTAVGYGLVLQNTGNRNVTLNLSGTKSAATLLAGTSPAYLWNVSNNETNSCRQGNETLGAFSVVNTSGDAMFCGNFSFLNDKDQVRIDFNLTVPFDSTTGALGDVITATVFAA